MVGLAILGILLSLWVEDDWNDKLKLAFSLGLFGALTGGVVGCIVAIIIGFLQPGHFIPESKTPLVALQDNTTSRGSFFLGSGSIQGEMRYFYFRQEGVGYKAESKPAYSSLIVEDEEKAPYLVEYHWRFINPNAWKWGLEPNTTRDDEFHIPKGSILRNYTLDLK